MESAPEIRMFPIPIVDDPGNGIGWLLLANTTQSSVTP